MNLQSNDYDPRSHNNPESKSIPDLSKITEPISSNIPPPNPQSNIYNQKSPNKKLGLGFKKIRLIAIISSVVAILFLAGWFSWRWYQRSSDERILLAAAQNLLNAQNLHSKATVGIEGFSLNFDIYTDKDQDVKATISLAGEGSAEGLWFPKEDKAYLGTNYGFSDNNEDKMEYIEFTNIKKTVEKYENEFSLADVLNPTKDFFSGENMEYVKREGTDNINGKELYKYSFKPSQEFIEEKINKATKDKDLPFILNKSEVEIIFWIQNKDLKINKLEGSITIGIGMSESERKKQEEAKQKCIEDFNKNEYSYYDSAEEACKYYDKSNYEEEYQIDWKQEFSYDFKDDITIPNEDDITESIDIYKELDQNYKNDQRKVSDLKKIQKALKEYHEENGYYPRKLEQLVDEKKPAKYSYSSYRAPYLYSMPESPDDNEYIYDPEGTNIQSYELKVKLAAPEYYNSSLIKDDFLFLTEATSSSFEIEESDKIANSSSSNLKARDARRKSDLREIQTALEQYADDNRGTYPYSLEKLSPDYISSLLKDPSSEKDYAYKISVAGTEYELNATLENSGDKDDENDGGNDSNVYEVGNVPGLDLI